MRPLENSPPNVKAQYFDYSRICFGIITFSASICLSGCVSSVLPTLKEPDRLYDPQEEISAIRQQVGPIGWGVDGIPNPEERNNYITLRMYAIDQNYTIYEKQLTHEVQETGLAASLINLGLTGAGSVAPTAEIGKALSAAATGFTGASQAYDKDVLLAQSVQNLQTQMRADRNAKAAIILTSMKCPVSSYNMGMVLSDLEEYYRAGTLPNALITISKTVGDAESQAKGAKESANPSAQIHDVGAARVNQPKSIETKPIDTSAGPACADLAKTIASNTGQAVSPRPPPPPPASPTPDTCVSLAEQLVANQDRLADKSVRSQMTAIAMKRRAMGCPPA